jgi:succinate dehydrogenase / fumarate reductase flavoprotein subunit
MNEVIIVGTGISGLMSAVMLAQSGVSVTMLSYLESIRSASCMAQGGINAAELRENDTVMKHFTETIAGGAWLADQQPVMEMCKFAPQIVAMYDRIGVAFNRHDDGSPDTRYFGGSKFKRTHYADTTTGGQLLNALDGQARRYEEQGLIKRISGKDFVCALIDENGRCRGCVTQDIYTMKMEAYTGTALIVATGGYSGLYGRSTNAMLSNGAVAGQLMLQGVPVGNPEFVQFHPTAMAHGDKPRLISESARGEGGRLWVLRNGKPWYFLEEMYPELGNLVTRDLASRAIYKVVNEMRLGVDRKQEVYLDITHLPKEVMEQKLSNVIDLYQKFSGEDPRKVPMKVYPSPHYAMGGIYVDAKHRTEVNGLYACGECDYLYHGGNRLGGNSLLSATYSGYIAAKTIIEDQRSGKLPESGGTALSWTDKIVSDREKEMQSYMKRNGSESVEKITAELEKTLIETAGIVRYNSKLENGLDKIQELKERWTKIAPADKGTWANSSVIAIRKLRPCLVLGQAIIAGALNRNESRGAHYKPDYSNRDDENWLKATIARYEDRNGKVALDYKPVDVSILHPGNSDSFGKEA